MGDNRLVFLIFCVLGFCLGVHGSNSGVSIVFLKAPKTVTSQTSATFAFEVSEGTNGELCSNCSATCKLDGQSPMDCSGKRESYTNLVDGAHKFEVCVNGSNGVSCSSYTWIIDTVPPTASISTATFTNKENISVLISFSEPCIGGGGFRCSSVDSCNLLVYGAGQIIPSTLVVLRPNMTFLVLVRISPDVEHGRIVLAMDRGFCTDAAGIEFLRSIKSTYQVHYDRRPVSANLTVHIPTQQLQVNNEVRLVEATNNQRNLKVYVEFSEPVLNSSMEILSVLDASSGFLSLTNGRTLGNRRFAFMVSNTSSAAVITIKLQTDSIISRHGTQVSPTDSHTFLYDSKRPSVRVSAALERRSGESHMPVMIKFFKPVFAFNASDVTISGGHLISFNKISWTLYEMYIQTDEKSVRVEIPENVTTDLAGNTNLPSNVLQLIHYSVPTVSLVLYTITSATFGVTALAASLLTLSTASLQAFGPQIYPKSSYLTADPSRNLMRIACHIQLFALTKWLPVTLPVEYYEFVRGLQWSIPYIRLPWESRHVGPIFVDSRNQYAGGHGMYVKEMLGTLFRQQEMSEMLKPLAPGAPINGTPLSAAEYSSFFEVGYLKPEAQLISYGKNTIGWKEFKRIAFWLAVIGGSLFLFHVIALLIMKLRSRSVEEEKRSFGALVMPRFEIFLTILALPCICLAAASLFKGGSTCGIIVGVILMGVSLLCVLSLLLFLTVGITMGKLLQYKEVHREDQEIHWYSGIMRSTLGPGKRGQWTWKNDRNTEKLTIFGPLFEDYRGPPKYMLTQIVGSKTSKTDQIIASEDETEDAEAPFIQKLFGILRIYYILIDSVKRVSLGIIAGAYINYNSYKLPVIIIFCITAFQLVFMVVKKPFIRKSVQLAEIVAIASQAGVFAACIVLLEINNTSSNNEIIGIIMLLLFVVGFSMLMINEWIALYKQVVRLSTGERHSFVDGLKVAARGLLLIVIENKDDLIFESNGDGKSRVGAVLRDQNKVNGVAQESSSRRSRSLSGSEKPWMRQLRDLAKASFSIEGSNGTESNGASNDNRRNFWRSGSKKGLNKELESIFSPSNSEMKITSSLD